MRGMASRRAKKHADPVDAALLTEIAWCRSNRGRTGNADYERGFLKGATTGANDRKEGALGGTRLRAIDWNVDLSPPGCLAEILEMRRDAITARADLARACVHLTRAAFDALADFAERVNSFGGGSLSFNVGDRIFGFVIAAADSDALRWSVDGDA